jgi:hypothetical protein
MAESEWRDVQAFARFLRANPPWTSSADKTKAEWLAMGRAFQTFKARGGASPPNM